MSPTEPHVETEEFLFCPECGYDLRGSGQGRCPECGLQIDHASLRVSGFPWAHRREVGRVRSYVKTVCQVTAGSKSLAYETAKPQALADARSFGRVTCVLVFLAIVAPFAAAAADAGGLAFLAIPAGNPQPPAQPPPGPVLDLIVPWAAGVTCWPVVILSLLMFSVSVARAPRHVIRVPRSRGPHERERAEAIAHYASAPLALLMLAVVCVWGVGLLAAFIRQRSMGFEAAIVLVLGALTITAASIIATFVRVGQWFARARRGGFMTGVVGAAALLGAWLVGAVACFGLFPWLGGFLWLAIDGLR